MTTLNFDSFSTYFAENRSAIETMYADFLRFPTVSADPLSQPHMEACAKWLVEKLQASGCTVELWEAGGAPIVFASIRSTKKDVPTVLIYNHYDVQPVDPIAEWSSDPFEATFEGDTVYARGAQDNKGQCLYVLLALEALKKGKELPCHLKFLIEGEEESSSTTLINIIGQKREQLRSDYTMIVDAGMRHRDTPAINLGTRGLTALTMTVKGANQDFHSGLQGGIAYNPLHALVALLASLRNDDGSIAVPGFYDGVCMPSSEDMRELSLIFDEKEWEEEYGQPPTGGEKAFSPLIRNWLRPTLEINGIHGGYGGSGSKTVIPREALAKITCRLVPNQDPLATAQKVKSFLLSHAPKGVTVEVMIHEGTGRATRNSRHSTGIQALGAAMRLVWNKEPEFILDGASIPIIPLLAEASGGETITWGVGLDTDRIHAPNERFDFTRMERGFLSLCLALELLGKKSPFPSSLIVE